MKVQCPNCSAVYKLDETKIPEKGTWAKCTKCGEKIRVVKEAASPPKATPPPMPPPEAPAPEPPTPPEPTRPPEPQAEHPEEYPEETPADSGPETEAAPEPKTKAGRKKAKEKDVPPPTEERKIGLFGSLRSESMRTTVLIFYALSSLVPTLVVLYIVLQYVTPQLEPQQVDRIITPLTYALLGMLIMPLLGYLIMSHWVRSIERLTEKIRQKTAEVMHDRLKIGDKNEIVAVERHLDDLYGELQDKISQLKEYSQELIESKQKLSELVIEDEVSTLYSRRHFDLRLPEEINRALRFKRDLSVVLIDIKGYDEYLEKRGQKVVDRLIQGLGLMIKDFIRKTDIACRYEANMFAVILPEMSVEEAAGIAQKIADTAGLIALETSVKGAPGRAALGCGVAMFAQGKGDRQEITAAAEQQAKGASPGSVVVSPV